MEGDEKKYGHLETLKGYSSLAAYDPLDMKKENLDSCQSGLRINASLLVLARRDLPHSTQFGLGTVSGNGHKFVEIS